MVLENWLQHVLQRRRGRFFTFVLGRVAAAVVIMMYYVTTKSLDRFTSGYGYLRDVSRALRACRTAASQLPHLAVAPPGALLALCMFTRASAGSLGLSRLSPSTAGSLVPPPSIPTSQAPFSIKIRASRGVAAQLGKSPLSGVPRARFSYISVNSGPFLSLFSVSGSRFKCEQDAYTLPQ